MAPLRAILPYLATFGWAVLAFLVGQLVASGAVIWWWHGNLQAMQASQYDGATVTISVLVLNPVTIGILLLAIRSAGANPVEYLAPVWPSRRDLIIGLVSMLFLIPFFDLLLYLSGLDLVTSFQRESYVSGAKEGWLPAMLVAAVVVAPAGEEALFRGFLFRGWARSERSSWPAIIAISILWAALHVQYPWPYIVQIFVLGLFLGWMRWRSGSTLLTFLLHMLNNLESTIETILQAKYFH